MDLRISGPVSGDELVAAAGFHSTDWDLPGSIRGLAFEPDRIYVQRNATPARKAFAKAHETSELSLTVHGERAETEKFHNAVAAELLIPTHELVAAIKRVGIDLVALKRIFTVPSMEAICRHIPGAVQNCWAVKWEGWSADPKWRRVGVRADVSPQGLEAEWEAIGECYLRGRGRGTARRPGLWAWAWRITDMRPHRGLAVVVTDG